MSRLTDTVPYPPNERFMDTDQVAEFLGVHRQTVYKMYKKGKLPMPIKIGRKKKWLESELRKFFNAP